MQESSEMSDGAPARNQKPPNCNGFVAMWGKFGTRNEKMKAYLLMTAAALTACATDPTLVDPEHFRSVAAGADRSAKECNSPICGAMQGKETGD